MNHNADQASRQPPPANPPPKFYLRAGGLETEDADLDRWRPTLDNRPFTGPLPPHLCPIAPARSRKQATDKEGGHG